MFKVIFKKKAEKELRKLPSTVLLRMVVAIDNLKQEPRPEGSKKMKGSEEEMWRVRVGNYRVIYLIEDEIKIVNVRKIAHRKDVYKL